MFSNFGRKNKHLTENGIVDKNRNLHLTNARVAGRLNTNDLIVRSKTHIKGDLHVDGHAQFPKLEILPYHFTANSCCIPTYLSQELTISSRINNLRIRLTALNDTGEELHFKELPEEERFQFWITYFDDEGNILSHPAHSAAFPPESIIIKQAPADAVKQSELFVLDLVVNGLHHCKPPVAKYWSLTMRVSDEEGFRDFDNTIPIDHWYCTPF